MSTPSLLNVPYRLKAGTLYSQIPETGLGDFAVTRATSPANNLSTRVNSLGFIERVNDGVPRLDYPLGGAVNGCPALLVEPSAANIMAQSETLSVNANWGQTAVLATGGAIASPDGLASGTLIVATSGSNTHWIERNAATTLTSGTVVTISCFFKAHGTNTFAQLVVGNIAFSPASPFANFNLTGSGSVTTGTYSSAFIQNYGNGWYRCGFTTTAAANGTAGINICPILASGTNRATSFTGDGVNGVYAWGAQMEAGSVATSYIPTTAAPVTRNADVVNLSGAVSGSIGQTEGTIYFEYYHNTASNAGIRNAFNLEGNVAGSFNGINFATSNNGNDLQVAVQVSSSSVVSGGAFSTSVSEGWHKVAFGYNAATSGTSFYFDGNLIATRTLTSIPAMSRISLMARSNPFDSFGLDRQFNDRIRAAALYTTRLTNPELAALTT